MKAHDLTPNQRQLLVDNDRQSKAAYLASLRFYGTKEPFTAASVGITDEDVEVALGLLQRGLPPVDGRLKAAAVALRRALGDIEVAKLGYW